MIGTKCTGLSKVRRKQSRKAHRFNPVYVRDVCLPSILGKIEGVVLPTTNQRTSHKGKESSRQPQITYSNVKKYLFNDAKERGGC